MNKNNLLVGQSGGPTAVINSSLQGVVKAGLESNEIGTVYGMVNGIEGFLKGNTINFTDDVSKEDIELLCTTPGAYLGSCRFKMPETLEDEIFPKAFAKFEEMGIGYVFYNGGNDSMDTVSKMSRYADKIGSDIKFIGVPKTVDNDLVMTDHTPGFASAARYVATTVREIAIDASVYDSKSVTIVEIMGRHAGWLTAAAALARNEVGDNPLLVYLPEINFDCDKFLKDVEAALVKNQNLVVCVSEGINDKEGTFICEYDSSAGVDSFGHKMLAGCGKYLENLVRDKLGVKARSVELNVSQRCSAIMQSKTDQQEAINCGRAAVAGALKGETGKMVAFDRTSGSDYSITYSFQDVNEICNKEKVVPNEWITNEGSDVSDEFIAYARPLIQGIVEVPLGEDGLPKYVRRTK
ncbi:MAG: 6-phosphofructokinase [Suipraeoptans sp.]